MPSQSSSKVYWLVRARDRLSSDWTVNALAYPANQNITASRVAEDFNHGWPGEYTAIEVAPVKAPAKWDAFEVVPERVERRGH